VTQVSYRPRMSLLPS